MKKIYFSLLCMLISHPFLQAAGGPDAYGYTWLTSADPGGPAVQFTNISGYGTLVTGLADDNSIAGMVNIGFPFHYYWNDYSQMKIGSNGWASFVNVGNIASCFPTIPTAGGPNDYLAPLMGDLNFTGAGNIGQVYTYTNNADTFIIMFKNVPFWSVNAPSWVGSNTFEIILCGSDSSITFQYTNLSGFAPNAACVDLTVGIENSTGAVGLQVYSDGMPPSNFAIKFKYPPVVLLSVPDVTPRWNENVDNLAVFIPTGNFNMTSNVKNVGNANINNSININGNIKNLANTTIFTSNFTLPNLQAGDDTTFIYPTSPTIVTGGEYYFQTVLTNASDINPGNNTLDTEIDLINICTPNLTLGYTSTTPNNGSINWNGGANDDGVAVHIVPPVYPVTITQMEAYIASNVGNGLLAKIYADDGPAGAPGTLLYNGTINSGSIIAGQWNVHPITPVVINSGGFYVTFFQTGTNIFIGTLNTGPMSRRNYEILDGAWATFRYNSTQDLMIRCQVTNPNSTGPAQPGSISGATSFCGGIPTDTMYSIAPVSGATSYTWNLPLGWTGTSNANTIAVTTGSTGGSITVSANNVCGSSALQTLNVAVNPLPTVTANATEDSVCNGASTILSGGGASSYVWSGGVTDGISFLPLTSATYTVTGTDGNTCSNTATIDIAVNDLPTVTANATEEVVCNGDPTVLTGGGASSYIWTGSVTDGVAFTPSTNATYTVTGTDANTCTNTASISIVVNDLPTVTFNYPGNDTICINYGIQVLSGGGPAGGTYTGNGVSGTNFDPNIAGIGMHPLTYHYTDANGCSNTDNVNMVVLGCSGIDQFGENMLSVYPNPFTHTITIHGIDKGAYIQLYNAWGEVMENRLITEKNPVIQVAHLVNGIYFLKVTIGNENVITKLIKQ